MGIDNDADLDLRTDGAADAQGQAGARSDRCAKAGVRSADRCRPFTQARDRAAV